MTLHRWVGLDIAKALCVLLMVFIHSSFWLITNQDEVMNTGSFMYPIVTRTTFLGLFPLSLPATAGCGLRLYMERMAGGGKEMDLKHLVKVSFGIMVLGYLMTIATWGADHGFEWDVLHFVGLSYLLIAVLMRLTTVPILLILGLFSLFATNPVRDLLAGSNGFLAGILVSDSSGYYFWPFFPWFSTLVFGFGVAHFYLQSRDTTGFRLALAAIAAIGIGFAASGNEFLLKIDPESVWGANVFQPSIGFVIGLIGFFSALILVGNLAATRYEPTKYGVIRAFSDGILWIYLIHIIIGARAARWYTSVFPLNVATALTFSFSLLVLSWGIGCAAVYLSEKRLRITLVKANG